MLKEFKEFALKGNMLDLAVGVIIGTAFNGIVKSLVDNIIMPILGIFTKGIDFNSLFLALDGKQYTSLAEAEAAGAALVRYGTFISGLLSFFIMAFVVFLVVKFANKFKREPVVAPAEPKTKTCPHCYSVINIKATKCPHCTSEQ